MGKPVLDDLPDALRAQILAKVELGIPPRVAVGSICGRTSWWKWTNWARAGKEPYASFVAEIIQREDEAQCSVALRAREAVQKDPTRVAVPATALQRRLVGATPGRDSKTR